MLSEGVPVLGADATQQAHVAGSSSSSVVSASAPSIEGFGFSAVGNSRTCLCLTVAV
jgi:hypothetical protein